MSKTDNRILSFIDTTEKPMYFASNGRPIYKTYYASYDGENRMTPDIEKGDEIRVTDKANGKRKYGIVQSVKPHCPWSIESVPYHAWSVKHNDGGMYIQYEETDFACPLFDFGVQAKETEAVQDIMSRNASLTMENWRLKDALKAVRALSDRATEKDGNIRAIVDSALARIDSTYSENRTYTIENLRHAPFYMMEQRTQEMLKALKELEEQE